MAAWSKLRGETIWYDEHLCAWRYTNGDPVTDFTIERAVFWDIQWTPNPWFSFGIHIDHQAPFVMIHLPGVMLGVGNLGYPGLGRGLRTGRKRT